MNINELVVESHERAKRKGFYDPPQSIPERLCLVHSEISEALEEFRAGRVGLWFREDGKPEGVSAEIADAIIRLCDLAGSLGIDLEYVIRRKSDFNESRPHRHGGKAL